MHKHEGIKVTKKIVHTTIGKQKTSFALEKPHYALPLHEI